MKFSLLYKQRWSWLYIPIFMLSGILLMLAVTEWMPLPPSTITIVAGDQPGNHESLAKLYRIELEQKRINASIVYTKSWSELSKTLAGTAQTAPFGFAQGIYATGSSPDIQALAVVAREPVWIFCRIPAVKQISQLAGLRVAAGPLESSSHKVAKLMLAHAGVAAVQWHYAPITSAANDLLDGKIDALIYVAGAQMPVVRQLSIAPGIQLLGIDHAVSLSARERSLRPFSLPQGAIELAGNIPPDDLTMQASLTHLLVPQATHPALQRLLIDVATAVHERPTFLQRHAEFPNTYATDFELSPVARNYTQGEKPMFESLLPYWWAQLAELLVFAVLPIILVTWFVLALTPSIFDLRVNAVLQHYYGELKFLENEIPLATSLQPIAIGKLMKKLNLLERQVIALELPDTFADRWYTLREHLAAARDRIIKSRGR